MAPLDPESQFKFLIACIKHTNAGKVDFGKVAEELNIVTKGAAAKRYERLMKAHGIDKAGGGNLSPASSSPGTPATPKTPSSSRKNGNARTALPNSRPTPASKKRKLAAPGNDLDDDEDIKFEIKNEIKQEPVNAPDDDADIST